MNGLVRKLKKSFRNKEYRHGYVDDFLNASIATQIKVLREQRGWSQKDLAEKADMLQPRISVLENINYSSWSIKILRKLAEAFDLTLVVSFESFGRRTGDIERFSRQTLERPSFENDPYFQEQIESFSDASSRAFEVPPQKPIEIIYGKEKGNRSEKNKLVQTYRSESDFQQYVANGG